MNTLPASIRARTSRDGFVRFSNPSGNCVEIRLMSDGSYRLRDSTDASRSLRGDVKALRDTVRDT